MRCIKPGHRGASALAPVAVHAYCGPGRWAWVVRRHHRMSLFARNKYEVLTEAPGRLTYRESNHEYVFPVFEEEGEMVIAGYPSRRRIHFFFGWYGDWRDFPASASARILPRLLDYFRRCGRQARIFKRGDA